MNLEEFKAKIEGENPKVIPLEPYVSGLTKTTLSLDVEDVCLNVAARIYLNDLEGAHSLIQDLSGNQEAAYLHGMIHRREGDFWNANYWFRQARSLWNLVEVNPEALTNQAEQGNGSNEDYLGEWEAVTVHILEHAK